MRRSLFVLLFSLIGILSGCVPGAKPTSLCTTGMTFDQASRQCVSSAYASGNKYAPTNTLTSVTLYEDVPQIIYLTYQDKDNDKASACAVSSLINISAGSCTCNTTAGTCYFTATPTANGNSTTTSFSFNYTVTANANTSTATSVTTTVTAVDDAPVALDVTKVVVEDTLSVVTFAVGVDYTDVDYSGSTVFSCSIFDQANIASATACSCVGTNCSVSLTTTSQLNGAAAASFKYQIFDTTGSSNVGLATLNVTAADDAPIGDTSLDLEFDEEVGLNVFLPYTDYENDVATACNITSATNLTAGACSCTLGTCSVTLTPDANENSDLGNSFSFAYTVTANAATSTAATVSSIWVYDIPDQPVGATTTASISEDTATTIAITYTDADQQLANGCSITSVTGGTAGSCTCSGSTYPNSCSFTFTPEADIATPSSVGFSYNLTTGYDYWYFATDQAVTIDVAATNDTPTMSATTTTLATNMNTILYHTIYLDEGGGTDENSQTVTVTFASSDTDVVPNANVDIVYSTDPSISFADGATDAGSDTRFLKITPATGEYGHTIITATISDGTNTTTKDFDVTVNPIYAVHNGFKNIMALGAKVDAAGNTLESAYVKLTWENFSVYGATASKFAIYRSTSSTIDFSTPIATTSAVYFVDSDSLTSGIPYYYAVRPMDDTNNIAISTMKSNSVTSSAETAGVYGNIEVEIPASNMALLHRWAANKEMCLKLNLAYDIDNNYRCAYTGPGNKNGYYDIEYDYLIDRFEQGCNYTTSECTGNGCIGYGNPNTVGCSGGYCSTSNYNSLDVFYDRSSGKCYSKLQNDTVWYDVNSLNTSSLDFTYFAGTINGKVANIPPLTNINSSFVNSYCTGRGDNAVPLSRKIFVAASAWDNSYNDATITSLENGSDLTSSYGCNSSAGSGLTFSDDFSFPTGINADTLPGSLSSPVRALITGSDSTSNCISRYGIQDLIGNVQEFHFQFFNCTSAQNCVPSPTPTTSGSINIDFVITTPTAIYGFDNSYGPGATTMSSVRFDQKLYGATHIYLPMGLPTTSAGISSEALAIGSTITDSQLHQDKIDYNTEDIFNGSGSNGVVTSGGSFQDGSGSGRYALEMVLESESADPSVGFRCMIVDP